MRTAKSISNICYYTPEYFALIIEQLHKADVVGPCYWVAHKGEGGDKDHIHLVLPACGRTYDTDRLTALFLPQSLPNGETASITPRWQVTKRMSDWLLYSVHDAIYLLRKGLVREEVYPRSDVQCTDDARDMLANDWRDADEVLEQGEDKVYRVLRICVKRGMTYRAILRAGVLPVAAIGNAYRIYCAMGGKRDYSEGGMEHGTL